MFLSLEGFNNRYFLAQGGDQLCFYRARNPFQLTEELIEAYRIPMRFISDVFCISALEIIAKEFPRTTDTWSILAYSEYKSSQINLLKVSEVILFEEERVSLRHELLRVIQLDFFVNNGMNQVPHIPEVLVLIGQKPGSKRQT